MDAIYKEEVRYDEEEAVEEEKEESDEGLVPHHKEKEESTLPDLTFSSTSANPVQVVLFILSKRL